MPAKRTKKLTMTLETPIVTKEPEKDIISGAGTKQMIEEKTMETEPMKTRNPSNPFRRINSGDKTVQLSIQPEEKELDDQYVLLASAQIRIQTRNGCSRLMNAICDTGAQANLITKQCADTLGLDKKPIKGNRRGLTGFRVQAKGRLSTTLFNRFEEKPLFDIELIVVQEIMPMHPAIQIETEVEDEIQSRLAHKTFNKPNPIEMLLGAETWARIIREGIRYTKDGLTMQDSELGWLVFGASNKHPMTWSRQIQLNIREQDELIHLMRQLCEVENPKETREWTPQEKWCESNFRNTVSRTDNRYCVTIPIDPDSRGLGDSRNMALRRFYALENRLAKNPVLARKYIEFMQDYERLGHMRKATRPIDTGQTHYYIPHHAVLQKFRVVFDASALSTNGLSFNEIQLAGPRIQDELYVIILQFRLGRIGINADIKKMFRQIKIDKSQWDMQRVFWREGPHQPISEYQLTVVTYGMKSSPFNSTRVLRQCGLDNADEFPETAEVIQRHFYVDDLLTYAHTEEQAVQLKEELRLALAKGGFELTKWHSNMPMIRDTDQGILELTDKENPSVLGLQWNQDRDTLSYKIEYQTQPALLTKRVIARESARVFDPLGYLAPIIIQAKLILQKLWRLKLDWDEPLDHEETEDWTNFHENLRYARGIEIPRWIQFKPTAQMELHAFADASARALGTVIYARITYDQESKVSILTAKSKVATKGITIPRLELAAAVMAVELVTKIKAIEAFTKCETYYWTDSMIVLNWLRREPQDLQVYVSNRILKIQTSTTLPQWRHITPEDNPADLISRGETPQNLKNNRLWWHGPQVIEKPREEWPEWRLSLSEEEEKTFTEECRKTRKSDNRCTSGTRPKGHAN